MCPVRAVRLAVGGEDRRRPARVVFARTSEPPCFSVMPMPASSPGLRGQRARSRASATLLAVRPGSHLGGKCRVGAQRRTRGIGHRDRAPMTGLDLRPRHEAGGAAQVRRRSRRGPPRRGLQPGASVPQRRARRATTGGSRPRPRGGRSGRVCAASVGAYLPRHPSAAPVRSPRAPRAVSATRRHPRRRTSAPLRPTRRRWPGHRDRRAAVVGSSRHGSGHSRGLP